MKKLIKRTIAIIMILAMISLCGCSSAGTGSESSASVDVNVDVNVNVDMDENSSENSSSVDSEVSSENSSKEESSASQSTSSKVESSKDNNSKVSSNTSSKEESKASKPTASKNESSKTSQTDSNNTEETKTLTIWDATDNPAMAAAAVKYEKENKGVKINIVSSGHTELSSLKTAIASQTAPDIIVMDHVYLVAAGTQGFLLDLTKYGANNIKSKFMESCWNASGHGGKIYGLPFDANTICLMYNKEILNAANTKVPTTLDEMKSASAAVKTKYGNSKYAFTASFGSSNKNFAAFQFFFWLWRNGGEVLNADYTKATFNSQAGVDALNALAELYKSGYVSEEYDQNGFLNGGVGMMENGTWLLEDITTSANKGKYGVALMPELKKGVPQYSGLGLYCYGVTSGSKNPELAYDFIAEFCTTDNYQLTYCKSQGRIPSLLSAQKDSYYSTEEMQVFIEQLKLSKARPGVNNWDRIEENIADAVAMVIKGEQDAKTALDASAAYVTKEINKTYD